MPKAINWPLEFFEEIINEDSDNPRMALRIGSLYFDNGYYVNGEIVDVRVDHKIVRQAIITDELKLYKIIDLPEEIILINKKRLRDKNEIISFLSMNYKQAVNIETPVTVIKYKNLPIEQHDTVDDPHAG
jgi:hypothetical protein